MRQGGYLITRGLLGSHTNMIIRGFITDIEEIIESSGGIIHGRSSTRRHDRETDEYWDEYTISAELSEINGKDVFEPIINKVSKKYKDKNIKIEVTPTKLSIRSPDIVVVVKVTGSRYVKN